MDALRSRHHYSAGHVIVGLLLAALAGLVGRLVFINSHHGPSLIARAERQQQSIVPLKHRRGLIVENTGRIIAGTLLRKSIFADPAVLPDRQLAAEKVAEILSLAAGEMNELAEDLLAAGDRRFYVIRRGVSNEQAELIRQSGIHGLGVFDEPYRVYPMNDLAAAVIGFVSPDGVGVSGLEYQCDQWLRGENGLKTIIRDARRKAFWLADGGYRAARDGFHVVLTLDAEIQSRVERELAAAVAQYRAESGVAIVMQAKTGAILAMANVPSFDPNNYGDYGSSRYRNRAITDPFEPGSTFKPFVAATALAEGVVQLGEVFDCENGVFVDGKRTLHDHHRYGLLTFEDVLIKSSNIGMAKIGKRLGNTRMYQGVRAFGFGETTGVDLLGEDPGKVRPLPRWNSFTTTSVPMGHEVSVTPLQLARAFCAFANGGRLVQPYIIRAVLSADGRLMKDFSDPPSLGQAIPEHIAAIIKDKILVEVVNRGTGSKAQLARYQVFGKTGTAQIAAREGGGYGKKAYIGSFVAGAPAGNPELVVVVSITRPDPAIAYYGGTIAAPVVREILAHALPYLQIPPERDETAAPLPTETAGGD